MRIRVMSTPSGQLHVHRQLAGMLADHTRCRKDKGKYAPLTGRRANLHPATMSLDHVSYDGQSEAASLHVVDESASDAIKLFEDLLLLPRRNADAVIGDGDAHFVTGRVDRNRDLLAVARVLHGVGEEIHDGLSHGITIDAQRGQWRVGGLERDGEAMIAERYAERRDGLSDELGNVAWGEAVLLLRRFDPGEVQNVVDEL